MTKTVTLLYRGTPEPEDRPGPRDFAGVFFSEDPKAASQYGRFLQIYRPGLQKLLDIDSPEARKLSRKYAGASDEDTMVPLFMFPDEEWTAALREHGYTGSRIGKDVFLAWPFEIEMLDRAEIMEKTAP